MSIAKDREQFVRKPLTAMIVKERCSHSVHLGDAQFGSGAARKDYPDVICLCALLLESGLRRRSVM
jgi:hypothetical protein